MGQLFTTLRATASSSSPSPESPENTQTKTSEAKVQNQPTFDQPSEDWVIIEECSCGEASTTCLSTKFAESSLCTANNRDNNRTTLESIPPGSSTGSFMDIPHSLIALEYNLTAETSGSEVEDDAEKDFQGEGQRVTTEEDEAEHMSLTEAALEGAKWTYSGARLVIPPLPPVMEDFVQTIEEGMGMR